MFQGRCVNYYGTDKPPVLVDVSMYEDPFAGIIKSTTGELWWRKNPATILVRAPKMQGVVGFVDNNEDNLGAIKLKIEKNFVSVFVASVDGKSLNKSKNMFMHAISQTKNFNMSDPKKISSGGKVTYKILRQGKPPILMKPVIGKITFKKPIKAVYALDTNGHRIKKIKLINNKSFKISTAKYQTVYYEIVR